MSSRYCDTGITANRPRGRSDARNTEEKGHASARKSTASRSETAQGLVDMAAAQNDSVYDAEQRAAQSTSPTSFRQWCEEMLKPGVLA